MYWFLVFSLTGLLAGGSTALELIGNGALRQLQALQSTTGPMDPLLAEPLSQLAEQYRRQGQYAEAHLALDRAMQIVRIHDGLYTRSQIPYLLKKIENYADWGDWEHARQLMEHLLWLHRHKSQGMDSLLLKDLMQLARFHLRGVAEDLREFQPFHFRRAAGATWLALAAGERLWSPADERLVPMLYSLLQQYYLQAVAVAQGGSTGYQLRQVVPGADWVRDRADTRRYFYQTGLRLLQRIEDIYSVGSLPDREALAMTRLHEADWQLMFSRQQEAIESYGLAFASLLQAGVPRELVDRYFSRAALLPQTQFHTSLATALAGRQPSLADCGVELAAAESALCFAEWSTGFPYTRSPFLRSRREPTDGDVTLLSFRLSGVKEISRWSGKRGALHFGELLDVTVIKPDADGAGSEAALRQRLQSIPVRPLLLEGTPQPTSATLVYRRAMARPVMPP